MKFKEVKGCPKEAIVHGIFISDSVLCVMKNESFLVKFFPPLLGYLKKCSKVFTTFVVFFFLFTVW